MATPLAPSDLGIWTAADPALRELDHRVSGGVEVTLLWSERTNRVFLSVVDRRTGSSFRVEVPPADALDAFRAFHV